MGENRHLFWGPEWILTFSVQLTSSFPVRELFISYFMGVYLVTALWIWNQIRLKSIHKRNLEIVIYIFHSIDALSAGAIKFQICKYCLFYDQGNIKTDILKSTSMKHVTIASILNPGDKYFSRQQRKNRL